MPRQPTPMQETEDATALHDREMVGAVPDKPMSPETKLWFREQLKKKGIKFAEPFQPKSETGSSNGDRATQDEEESVPLAMEAEKLRRLRVRQQAEADLLPNSSKQQKPTRKPTE